MPELPEVQTVVNHLSDSKIIDQTITSIDVFWEKIVSFSKDLLNDHLIFQKIKKISRRGKYLVFHLSNHQYLIVHLRMSGQFFLFDKAIKKQKHEHVIIYFENDLTLRLHDPRKFGRFYLANDLDRFFHKLGIEPLSDAFTEDVLKKLLLKNTSIKQFLLDQSFIAGLGNIYVDEALWLAKIHPLQKACDLQSLQIKKLLTAIQYVLQQGLKFKGTSLGHGVSNFHTVNGQVGDHQHHLNVYKRESKNCKDCQTPISKMRLFQRGTHFCPNCQVF